MNPPSIVEPSTVSVRSVESGQLATAVAEALARPRARFADLFASDGDPLVVNTVIAFDGDDSYLVLRAPESDSSLPVLSPATPAAFVEECELFEQFGLTPPAGYELNRLTIGPSSVAPLPRLGDHVPPEHDPHAPHAVGGHAFEFPVGPVRASGVESMYYGLVTSGEEVVDLYLFTWHKFRGIERRLHGMRPEHALFLVERGEGLSAVATSWAFAAAVESARGVIVRPVVARSRGVLLELERLYNHAACVAALAQSTGLTVGQAQAEIALEQLLRVNAAAAGHRYLFGAVAIDALGRPLDRDVLRGQLPAAVDELRRVMDNLLRTNSFLDRLESTGEVSQAAARDLGLVGPVARGSGHPVDARVDHPRRPYPLDGLTLQPAVERTGDCLGRFLVMRREIEMSVRIINTLLSDELDPPPTVAPPPQPWGLGWAESPRGETLAWVELSDDGTIRRARLRTGSARDWRAFDDAARTQNVFTDIPIIEASFWLTTAGRVL